MAKREAFVVEKRGEPVKSSLSNEWASALAATMRGRVTRYVSEARGWAAWAAVSKRGRVLHVDASQRVAKWHALVDGDRVIRVRVEPVEPVEPVKRAKRKGGS